MNLSDVLVRRDDSSNPTSLSRRDLLDWSIATRLGLVEGILIHAEYENIDLACSSVIPIDVVSEMRQLNRVRNEFSHSQTKSSRQAEKIIEECKNDLLRVLGDLQELEDVDLFRIERIPLAGNATLEVERLAGYTGARRIRELVVTPQQVAGCVGKAPIRNYDRVLVRIKSEIYDASPFFYCSDDISGHRTRLYVFKQHKQSEGRVHFEAVAESELRDEADGDFLTDIGRIKELIG